MKALRLVLIVGLVPALLAAPITLPAQPSGKLYRLGFLELGGGTPDSAAFHDLFRQGLRELGYVEGQNLAIEWRFARLKTELLPGLAAELVRLKVDVIVAATTSPAHAARKATSTIPIVMLIVPDPVGAGLVASLAHPSGNVTGLSFFMPDLVGKQLELLKEIGPQISRVAVLRDPASPGHRLMLEKAEIAARALGIHLQVVDAGAPGRFDGAFATMIRGRAEGLIVPAHPLFARERAQLAELAARHRLPAMYGALEHAQAGGLIAYAPNLSDSYRRGAYYVDKILRGAKPADLPVEQPAKFQLMINLKTAKVLGLTIPPAVLARADSIID